LKLFSFYQRENEQGIGVETPAGTFNLTHALDIYQRARNIKSPVSFSFLQVLVEMGYCSSEMIQSVLNDPWVQSKQSEIRIGTGLHFLLPIARPTKIIGIGRNYKAHAEEFKHEVPKEPIFFSKAPSALIPHKSQISIPSWLEGRVDHEAELALIIGQKCKNVHQEEAMSFIAGYTILNDVTARTMQKEDTQNNRPWYRSKSIDTFCPMGPYLVPADEIEDPQNLNIRLTVNGETRQEANTASMIFKIPQLVVYLSKFFTLEPGDVIATGTPQGVSPLENGDNVEITITNLGKLQNKVVRQG
jgi:5-oxopent-3-ene-1,2,5-tricarboxylate decarboxylase/2-hydroxyhepta-2,4-diene-1,7-dioate isomerase